MNHDHITESIINLLNVSYQGLLKLLGLNQFTITAQINLPTNEWNMVAFAVQIIIPTNKTVFTSKSKKYCCGTIFLQEDRQMSKPLKILTIFLMYNAWRQTCKWMLHCYKATMLSHCYHLKAFINVMECSSLNHEHHRITELIINLLNLSYQGVLKLDLTIRNMTRSMFLSRVWSILCFDCFSRSSFQSLSSKYPHN